MNESTPPKKFHCMIIALSSRGICLNKLLQVTAILMLRRQTIGHGKAQCPPVGTRATPEAMSLWLGCNNILCLLMVTLHCYCFINLCVLYSEWTSSAVRRDFLFTLRQNSGGAYSHTWLHKDMVPLDPDPVPGACRPHGIVDSIYGKQGIFS